MLKHIDDIVGLLLLQLGFKASHGIQNNEIVYAFLFIIVAIILLVTLFNITKKVILTIKNKLFGDKDDN